MGADLFPFPPVRTPLVPSKLSAQFADTERCICRLTYPVRDLSDLSTARSGGWLRIWVVLRRPAVLCLNLPYRLYLANLRPPVSDLQSGPFAPVSVWPALRCRCPVIGHLCYGNPSVFLRHPALLALRISGYRRSVFPMFEGSHEWAESPMGKMRSHPQRRAESVDKSEY